MVDIKSAYRSVNISVGHRTFQGFCWEHDGRESIFTDNCLSFGLRCAPSIFTRLTEFMVRCMAWRGYHQVYGYIDDFLVVGFTLEECNEGLHQLLQLLRVLGFYVSWDKIDSPSQVIKYLGSNIDTCLMELSLPVHKLSRVKDLVKAFQGYTHANKRQILVLAGFLSHCSQVVRGGVLEACY